MTIQELEIVLQEKLHLCEKERKEENDNYFNGQYQAYAHCLALLNYMELGSTLCNSGSEILCAVTCMES